MVVLSYMSKLTAFLGTFWAKIKKSYYKVRGFFPEAMPTGMTEFENWSQAIADTYTLPTTNMDSIRFALSTVIMHLGPTAAYKSKFYFVLVLRSGGAKQVAGAWFQQIKEKQKAEQLAAQVAAQAALPPPPAPGAAPQPVEATTPTPSVVANAQTAPAQSA